MERSSKQKASGFLRQWMETGTPEPDTPKLAGLNRRVDRLRGEAQRLEAALHASADVLIEHGTVLARKQVRMETGRKSGGDEAGKRRARDARPKHDGWITRAKGLVETGRKPHELASIIANGNANRAKQVRTVLQDAGIVPRRKKGK